MSIVSTASIRPDLNRIRFSQAWLADRGPRAIVQLGDDIDLTFVSSKDAQCAADACLKAAKQLRELEAKKPPTNPNCSACFGTGLIHAGKERPEVCAQCFPEMAS